MTRAQRSKREKIAELYCVISTKRIFSLKITRKEKKMIKMYSERSEAFKHMIEEVLTTNIAAEKFWAHFHYDKNASWEKFVKEHVQKDDENSQESRS